MTGTVAVASARRRSGRVMDRDSSQAIGPTTSRITIATTGRTRRRSRSARAPDLSGAVRTIAILPITAPAARTTVAEYRTRDPVGGSKIAARRLAERHPAKVDRGDVGIDRTRLGADDASTGKGVQADIGGQVRLERGRGRPELGHRTDVSDPGQHGLGEVLETRDRGLLVERPEAHEHAGADRQHGHDPHDREGGGDTGRDAVRHRR